MEADKETSLPNDLPCKHGDGVDFHDNTICDAKTTNDTSLYKVPFQINGYVFVRARRQSDAHKIVNESWHMDERIMVTGDGGAEINTSVPKDAIIESVVPDDRFPGPWNVLYNESNEIRGVEINGIVAD